MSAVDLGSNSGPGYFIGSSAPQPCHFGSLLAIPGNVRVAATLGSTHPERPSARG
jgi:hypothetical protein